MLKRILEQGEIALMWPFYLALFIAYASDATALIWIVYLLQKGFTFTQIAIATSFIFIGTVLFEIPTGAIADSVGRKKSVIFGCLAMGACWLIIPFAAHSFGAICILVLINALAFTFMSGADYAWMVDLLKSKGKAKYVQTFFIHLQTVTNIGLFVAGLLGAFLIYKLGMDWLFYAGGSGAILGGLIFMFGNEKYFKRKKLTMASVFSETIQNSKNALKFTVTHKIVLMLTLGAFFYMMMGISFMCWQPYLLEQGIQLAYLPLIGSAGAIIGAVTPQIYRRTSKKNKEPNKFISYSIALKCVLFLLVFFIAGPFFALLVYLLAWYGVHNVFGSVDTAYFQKFLPSSIRATITSTRSMIMGIPGIIAFITGGILADLFGVRNGIVISGLATIPAIFFYYFAKAKTATSKKIF